MYLKVYIALTSQLSQYWKHNINGIMFERSDDAVGECIWLALYLGKLFKALKSYTWDGF